MEATSLALTICAAGVGCAIACLRGLERRIARTAAAIRRNGVLLSDARRLREMQLTLIEAQASTEATVEGGTSTVRALHLGIAGIPFAILEALPVTRGITRLVHRTHDFVSETVYGTIRGVNRVVGGVARGVIVRSRGSSRRG